MYRMCEISIVSSFSRIQKFAHRICQDVTYIAKSDNQSTFRSYELAVNRLAIISLKGIKSEA